MSIAAKRFEFLDKETNLAVAEFNKIDTNAIFNSVNNEFKEISGEISSFISNFQGSLDINGLVDDVKNKLSDSSKSLVSSLGLDGVSTSIQDFLNSDIVRDVKGLVGKVMDLGGIDNRGLEKLMSGLTKGVGRGSGSGQQANNVLNQLARECKTGATGSSLGIGKPFDLSVACGSGDKRGGSSKCSTSEVSNVINKLTDGEYNSTVSDLNAALKGLVALSKLGFDANLCGVFGALSQDMDLGVKSRASSALLTMLVDEGNTDGILDLASSSVGLNTVLEAPTALNKVLESFSIPDHVRENDFSNYGERVLGAIEIFKDNWNKSEFDDMLSIGEFDRVNESFSMVARGMRMDNVSSRNSLDTIFDSDKDITSIAFSALF